MIDALEDYWWYGELSSKNLFEYATTEFHTGKERMGYRMDIAVYYPRRKTVYAKQVAAEIQRDPSARLRYRSAARNLRCPECDGNAWFRSGSRNGRAPTFGAHHDEDCQLASSYPESDLGVLEASAPEVVNEFKQLSIRFTPLGSYLGPSSVRERNAAEDTAERKGRSHLAEYGESSSRTKYVELRSILGNLVNVPTYVEDLGDLRINLPDRPNTLPGDAFWSMDDFDPDDSSRIGKQIIAWGEVRTVNPKIHGTYFNQGVSGFNKGAIFVRSHDVEILVDQYSSRGIQDAQDFEDGWFIAAIGRTRIGRNNAILLDPLGEHVDFYLPRNID